MGGTITGYRVFTTGIRKMKKKKKKKKWIKGQKTKLSIPTRAIDALIGEVEQIGKQKKEKQGAVPQPNYTGPFGCILGRAGKVR